MEAVMTRRTFVRGCLSIPFLLGLEKMALAQPQDTWPRVRTARAEKQKGIETLFAAAGFSYPPKDIFLRGFKEEGELELFALPHGEERYALLKTYEICATSGRLGPKRTEGDMQVPEGFYRVNQLNPSSNFYLSFQIDYPNASDRCLGRAPYGGQIFIHGSCATIGCIPITDEQIKELYLIVLELHSLGRRIPVHLFPARLTDSRLETLCQKVPGNAAFWRNLKVGYDLFEERRRPPVVSVDSKGVYRFQ